MIYEAQCSKCGETKDYFASVDDRDKKVPKCCGKKMARVMLTPPQVGAMSWAGWKGFDLNGRHFESGSEYKKYMKQEGYIPLHEGEQEAKKAKAEIKKKQKQSLRNTIAKTMKQQGL